MDNLLVPIKPIEHSLYEFYKKTNIDLASHIRQWRADDRTWFNLPIEHHTKLLPQSEDTDAIKEFLSIFDKFVLPHLDCGDAQPRDILIGALKLSLYNNSNPERASMEYGIQVDRMHSLTSKLCSLPDPSEFQYKSHRHTLRAMTDIFHTLINILALSTDRLSSNPKTRRSTRTLEDIEHDMELLEEQVENVSKMLLIECSYDMASPLILWYHTLNIYDIMVGREVGETRNEEVDPKRAEEGRKALPELLKVMTLNEVTGNPEFHGMTRHDTLRAPVMGKRFNAWKESDAQTLVADVFRILPTLKDYANPFGEMNNTSRIDKCIGLALAKLGEGAVMDGSQIWREMTLTIYHDLIRSMPEFGSDRSIGVLEKHLMLRICMQFMITIGTALQAISSTRSRIHTNAKTRRRLVDKEIGVFQSVCLDLKRKLSEGSG